MKRKAFFILLSIIMVFSVVASGCSSKETSKENTENKEETPTDPNNENKAAGKKTFVFARGADSVQLDPSKVTDGESMYVTNQIYDTLVRYKEENTEVVPALATEWSVSEDGKEWTFKLRKGVTFHDGTDFTAEDVVFNFERWATSGEFVYYGYMFGASVDDMGGIIEKVEAVSDDEVKFTLEQPNAPFLYTLAMPSFGMASQEAVEKHASDYFKNPVGTGPFVFKEWVKDDKIILEKNPDYFGEVAKIDQVIFRVIPDNGARFMELQAGTIDVMNGLNPQDLVQVEGDDNLQTIFRPSMNVGYLAFNTDKSGPMSNKKVRKAVNLAIDKEKLMTIYEGVGEIAKNPMPPSIWGYNDTLEEYGFDIEEAKRLLVEAGYEKGFSVTLYTMSNPRDYMPQPKLTAQAIQQMLKEVKIDVQIVENDWDTHLTKTHSGEHDMAFLGWTGDNGDPDNFLYVLLDKDNTKIGTAGNIAFYKNDEVHDLLLKAQTEMDQEKRTEYYLRAQEIILDDAPWVPIAHTTPPLAARKEIKNYIPHPTGSEPFNHVVKE